MRLVLVFWSRFVMSLCLSLSRDAETPLYRFLDPLRKNEKRDEALRRSSLVDRQEWEYREYEMPVKLP